MPKYEPKEYRCKVCAEYYHTEQARNSCENSHEAE